MSIFEEILFGVGAIDIFGDLWEGGMGGGVNVVHIYPEILVIDFEVLLQLDLLALVRVFCGRECYVFVWDFLFLCGSEAVPHEFYYYI